MDTKSTKHIHTHTLLLLLMYAYAILKVVHMLYGGTRVALNHVLKPSFYRVLIHTVR